MTGLADALRSIVPESCLVLPSSPDYDEARLVYNRMHDVRPAALVRSLDPDVLRAALAVTTRLEVPLAVRGGGHHIGGFSTVEDGLVIDFSTFRGVEFDPGTGLVRVQPGTRLGDLDTCLAAHGRCVPTGTVSDTGIAGLTLGGGIGWLVAGYGLTCDYLHSARILLASGEVIEASAAQHSELFSALRGGGFGAFGVVLELCYSTVPLPRIKAGSLRFPLAAAGDILGKLHELLARSVPDTLTLAPCLDFRDGTAGLSVDLCCHSDDERELERVRQAVGGDWSGVTDQSYPRWQSCFDGAFLPAQRGYWKSVHFDHLALDPGRLVEAIRAAPDNRCSVLIEYYNVDTLRAHAANSAYPLRDSRMGVLLSARWPDPGDDDVHAHWARSQAEALRTEGGAKAYSNYSQAGERQMRPSYPPEVLAACRELEARYDPDRLFARGHRAALAPLSETGVR